MDEPGRTKGTLHLPSDKAAGKAADAEQQGISAAKRTVDQAADKLSDAAKGVRDTVTPALDEAADEVGDLAKQAQDALQQATQSFRATMSRTSESAVSYTKEEPVKALLMAAAAGAVLMAILSLMGRTHR